MIAAPKLAVLANPQGGNNRTDGPAVAALVRSAGLAYREASEPEAIRSSLRELAAGRPEVLVVSGGDGTISAVATILRQEVLFESEPILALLRGGSTNLIQHNIGSRRRPIEAMQYLRQLCEQRVPEHLVMEYRPIRVQLKGTDRVHRGFFLGAGALPRILRAVQTRYAGGARRGLMGEGMAFCLASWRGLFGNPRNDAWLAPAPIACVRGEDARLDGGQKSERILLLVTGLNRLVLGLGTHLQKGGLRCLALNYPYSRLKLAAYALFWGRVFPWMRGTWEWEECDAFSIQVWEDWVLDGQIYPVDPGWSVLQIKRDRPFRFLAV